LNGAGLKNFEFPINLKMITSGQSAAPPGGRHLEQDNRAPGKVVRHTAGRLQAQGFAGQPSPGAATLFEVQLLGQDGLVEEQPGFTPIDNTLDRHRDGLALGSSLYQRAGGAPRILPSDATFLRLAV
jgi:hypothetical protein